MRGVEAGSLGLQRLEEDGAPSGSSSSRGDGESASGGGASSFSLSRPGNGRPAPELILADDSILARPTRGLQNLSAWREIRRWILELDFLRGREVVFLEGKNQKGTDEA